MKPSLIFPTLQMLMCIGAGIFYAVGGDFKKAVYWFCAGAITATVTY